MIYFDNAATSTPYQEVVDTYVKLVSLLIGNPSSKNLKGLEASNYIEKARNQIKRNLLLPNDYIRQADYFHSCKGGTTRNDSEKDSHAVVQY